MVKKKCICVFSILMFGEKVVCPDGHFVPAVFRESDFYLNSLKCKKITNIKRFHVTTSPPSSRPSPTAASAATLPPPPSCRRHRQAAAAVLPPRCRRAAAALPPRCRGCRRAATSAYAALPPPSCRHCHHCLLFHLSSLLSLQFPSLLPPPLLADC
jgi:hypothetical protein